MKRSTRAELAAQTLQIINQGWYDSPQGQRISIAPAITAAVDNTVLYDAVKNPLECPAQPHEPKSAALEVTSESTFEALRRLNHAGAKQLGCLNFASAKNPGGGFLNGAQAQEEALARSSGLYPCLLATPEYYERNRANSSCLYLDLLIASPDVPFFRDDSGQLLEEPVLATVITSPAPNAGAVTRNEPERLAEVESTLRRRAELVLRVAVQQGITDLVLGAWGCGVFSNDPAQVAATFSALLRSDGPYSRHFERIVFAIFDPSETGPNLAAFRNEFP